MKVILALIALLIPFVAACEKTITSDSENYYAIGYSENSSEQLAKQDSCNGARRELIGYVFGAAYSINSNMIRSLGVLDYSQDVNVNSGEIIIRGGITENSKQNNTTKCSISYPIQEAKIERERLKSVNNFKSTQFTDVGNANEIRGGVLEVVTIPDDADVFIDNKRWGTTPLRLNGKLEIGERTIRIEHDNYKTVEVKKMIGASAKTRIEQILKRATGKLRIVTDPEGASVMIDGQAIGQSPTNEIEILSGHKAKIEVSHPEANTTMQTISLKGDEERTLNLQLQLKPSSFSVHVNPSGSSIRLDDNKTVSADQWITAGAGSHGLTITKDGYEDQSVTFDLRGGERKTLPSIDLRSISKEKERHLKNGPRWSLGLYLGVSQSPLTGVDPSLFQAGIQTRFQLSRLISSELIATYDTGSATYSDATLNATGYQASLGFPIRLYQSSSDRWAKRLSLAPVAAWSSHTYGASYKTTGGSSASKTYSQMGYGGSLIYSLSTKTDYKERGYFLDFRIGAIQYQDASPLKGAMPISYGITMGVNW